MDIVKTLLYLRPSVSSWVLDGPNYSDLKWLSSDSKPTEQELLSAWDEIKDKVAWGAVRIERNRRLASSDWSMLPDAKVDKPYWENYRQTLRDVPQRFATPEEVVWPQEPS
jgi:hypothetical protein